MQEAVASLRAEYGSDAIILQTTQRRRWLWGRIGPKVYEVVGAIDRDYKAPQVNSRPQAREEAPAKDNGPVRDTPKFDSSMSEAVQNLYRRLMRRDIPQDLTQSLLERY